jgi:hypothetical protein
MQITHAGVTVRPLAFHFGVVMLSGGATTGGSTSGGGPGGTSGGGVTGGGVTGGTTTGSSETTGGGGGGGFVPAALGVFGLLLGGLGIAASAPPAQPPAVAGGPAIIAPAAVVPAPVVAPAPAGAPGALGSQGAPTTPAPIVLAASAAQPPAGAPVAAASPPKKAPGVVLPFTGANVWLPIATGSGLIGFGVWLRMFGHRFWEDESQQG